MLARQSQQPSFEAQVHLSRQCIVEDAPSQSWTYTGPAEHLNCKCSNTSHHIPCEGIYDVTFHSKHLMRLHKPKGIENQPGCKYLILRAETNSSSIKKMAIPHAFSTHNRISKAERFCSRKTV